MNNGMNFDGGHQVNSIHNYLRSNHQSWIIPI